MVVRTCVRQERWWRMFVHIGGDVIVFVRDIIGIFDLETTTTLPDTRMFLKTAEEEGFLMTIGNDLPKAFVVVETEYRYQVYLTSISSATLVKRCGKLLTDPAREPEQYRWVKSLVGEKGMT